MSLPWTLRQGRWQDVLADVGEVDAVITDPPYSERTHAGYRSGSFFDSAPVDGAVPGLREYSAIDRDDCFAFADFWSKRARSWSVIFGDHYTHRWHADAWEAAGWYVFAPVGWLKPNAPPRFSGDGPARTVEWVMVARPRRPTKCGSLPGHYQVVGPAGDRREAVMPGQKDLHGMRSLIRDYSDTDALIADPFAGSGTTLLAASIEGRRSIGAEMDEKTFAKAKRRLESGFTQDMWSSRQAV